MLHEYILRGVLRVLITGRISRFPLRRSIDLRSILTHDAWEASSAEDEKAELTAASSGDLSDATTVTGQSASVHENSQSPKDSCATTKDCVETELRARATPSCCCCRRRIRQGVYERFAVCRRSQRAELSLVTSRWSPTVTRPRLSCGKAGTRRWVTSSAEQFWCRRRFLSKVYKKV